MIDPIPTVQIESADGVRLRTTDGRELIDGMSSWWSTIHGYNHPVLNSAVTDQLEKMSHVMFGGLTHEPAIRLGRQLLTIAPQSMETIFYCDSGSVAVEVAIKMAIQFCQATGRPTKQRLLTIRNGYHGDTFAAMSVCDPVTGMHQLFDGVLVKQYFADAPQCRFHGDWNQSDLDSFRALIDRRHDELAAVILEPIVQGAGGMRFYHAEYLRGVRELCDQYNVLLIHDEIATGFGRTGRLFASEYADVEPDILCVGKALTGGYMTLAATLACRRVSDAISASTPGTFMHGPTFMANPLACAVASANLQLLSRGEWPTQVARLESALRTGLEPLAEHRSVHDVRVLGGIGVVELVDPVDVRLVQPRLVDLGVWLRPFGRLLYTMPPFVSTADDVRQIVQAIDVVVREIGLSHGNRG